MIPGLTAAVITPPGLGGATMVPPEADPIMVVPSGPVTVDLTEGPWRIVPGSLGPTTAIGGGGGGGM